MNKLFIIGNLVRDPELRTTQNGKNVCTFTVAVNRRKSASGQQEADFFRVSAWDKLGDNCQKYLTKGKKVNVVGAVKVSTYTANDGSVRAQLEMTADDVEFLSQAQAAEAPRQEVASFMAEHKDDFEEVTDDDLTF